MASSDGKGRTEAVGLDERTKAAEAWAKRFQSEYRGVQQAGLELEVGSILIAVRRLVAVCREPEAARWCGLEPTGEGESLCVVCAAYAKGRAQAGTVLCGPHHRLLERTRYDQVLPQEGEGVPADPYWEAAMAEVKG